MKKRDGEWRFWKGLWWVLKVMRVVFLSDRFSILFIEWRWRAQRMVEGVC